MEFEILLTDLQKVIASQNPKMSKEQRDDLMTNQGHSMTWKRYHRLGGELYCLNINVNILRRKENDK